jgi:hypothetical protein
MPLQLESIDVASAPHCTVELGELEWGLLSTKMALPVLTGCTRGGRWPIPGGGVDSLQLSERDES